MNSGMPGAGNPRIAAALAATVSRIRRFVRPGHRLPGDRIAQLEETELPNKSGQRCGLGLLGQLVTATTGVTAMPRLMSSESAS